MTTDPNSPHQNIEVKACYPDLAMARRHCRQIGAECNGLLKQVDTYFRVPAGRLKLRQIDGDRAELIEYHRANQAATRESNYTITPIQDAGKTIRGYSQTLGILCTVIKRRELHLWQNVRIHLDEVDSLGSFIEFEGVVGAQADARLSTQRVNHLVEVFSISPKDRIATSYSDLLLANEKNIAQRCGWDERPDS